MLTEDKLTLIEHLKELRRRIIKSILFVIVASCLVYGLVDIILSSLVKPVGRLVFTAPQEAFVARIKLSFFVGLFLSLPFILYEI